MSLDHEFAVGRHGTTEVEWEDVRDELDEAVGDFRALAAQVHPVWVGLYPLLGFAAEARRSAVLWLRAECISDHQAAA